MKSNASKIAVLSFVVLVATLSVWLSPTLNVCQARDIYSYITPDIIKFYESEIAHQKVLSHKSQSQIEQTANALNISPNKAKTLMILQDFSTRTGNGVSLKDLAKMSDAAVVLFAKTRIDAYLSTLTPERKQYLVDTLKSLVKK